MRERFFVCAEKGLHTIRIILLLCIPTDDANRKILRGGGKASGLRRKIFRDSGKYKIANRKILRVSGGDIIANQKILRIGGKDESAGRADWRKLINLVAAIHYSPDRGAFRMKFHITFSRISLSAGVATALLSLMLPTALRAQYTNKVAILPTDSPDEIVGKAARVVPSERQLRWQRQELTAFVHFGMNTFTDSEWGSGRDSAGTFLPTDLDARQWVRELRRAGFRSVILTCKHHDGFCLWPTAYTDYSVRSTAWRGGKGDVVREVSDACHKEGVGFGVYLSPWDRHSPLYGTEAYNDFFVAQLRELLTNYGKVSEVWFDGACGEGPNGKKQRYDFVRWYQVIRSLQPDAVIAVMGPDVRWVGTESGRGRETEWSVVPIDRFSPDDIARDSQQEVLTAPVGDIRGEDIGGRDKIMKAHTLVWYPAETDVSIRPGWFYHRQDDAASKTPAQLLDIYFTSVGRNGVLLLNVPPDTRGRLSDVDIRHLRGFAALRDSVFRRSLLRGARVVTGPGLGKGRSLTDGRYKSSFSPAMGGGEAVISFTTPAAVTASLLMLQEDIRKGQHIEEFRLEAKDADGSWRSIARGTTVGYKRIIRFPAVTARDFRLVITASRTDPVLSEVGLYNY